MTRRRELELLGMTAFAAAPLYLTDVVGLASLVAFHVVMLGMMIRVAAGRGPELIPPPIMRVLAIAYVPFYIIDAAAISESTIAASTHLVLFIAAYQPVESSTSRGNHAQRLLTAALLFIASLATSTHITIIFFVIVFGWLMFRQLMDFAHVETARSVGRDYAEAPSARAAVFYLAAATLIAAVLFPLLPRVRNPLVQGFSGSLPGATTGLSEAINFDEPRQNSSDGTIVARVWMDQQTIPFFVPLRLRGTIYDRFREGSWRQSNFGRRAIGARDGVFTIARPSGVTREAIVQMRPMRGRLFVPVGTYAITGLSNLAEGPTRDAYHVMHGRSGEVVTFTARMASESEPLRATRVPPLSYPMRDDVKALAVQIVGGEQRLEQRAALIEQHLSTRFAYVADPASLPRMTVEQFLLQERRGHCEYFAAGMVVLLTSLEIPARMAGGFYGGRLNPLTGYFTVRREDAHAWVEVWDGTKWTTFDPTPAALRPGNASESLMRMYAAALSDSVNYFWDRYILTYGLGDQIALATDTITRIRDLAMSVRGSVAANMGELRSRAFIVLMSLVIAAGIVAIFLAARRRPIFELLAAHLERLGSPVGPSTTLEEALRDVRERHPEHLAELEELVRLYEEEEFSARRDAARRRELRRKLAEFTSG